MLHVFHPPHQYIITSQITWDFGSSFSNSFFYSHLFGYSPLSLPHLFYSLLPCACHQEKQAELGRKLEELTLKNLYWKKKKKFVWNARATVSKLSPLSQLRPTQVRLPFSCTCASQAKSENAMSLVLNLVQCKN